MTVSRISPVVLGLSCLMVSTAVMAHPGHEHLSFGRGLLSGALHPLLGLDHLLILCAVGALSASLGGAQRWLLPLLFVGLMCSGFVMAHAGWHGLSAATVETMITASVCAAAALLMTNLMAVRLLNRRWLVMQGSMTWAMLGFALFHGIAHGLETPADASATGFALGFAGVSAVAACSVTYAAMFIKRTYPVSSATCAKP